MLRLLARIATEALVAILLDDVQWADSASLELVIYISRELVALPVLIISTRRPEDMEPSLAALRDCWNPSEGPAAPARSCWSLYLRGTWRSSSHGCWVGPHPGMQWN